jgi:restriction endonuclease S subunit
MACDLDEGILEDFIDFKNGKSSPERNDADPFNVYGSNGIIGKAGKTNAGKNTLIIGRVGTYCGSVYYSPDECWVTDNAIIGIARYEPEARFWYYQLLSLGLNNYRAGSGQPLLNQQTLNSIEISVPGRKDRLAIAHILGTLDDKIELNRRVNETLEAIAQTIFKSWFVDFDPVRAKASGEPIDSICRRLGLTSDLLAFFPDSFEESQLEQVPKGWKVQSLAQLSAKISKGTTPTKQDILAASDESIVPFVKVKDISSSGEINRDTLEKIPASVHRGSLRRSILEEGDILFSIAGTIGRVAVIERELANSNTTAVFT